MLKQLSAGIVTALLTCICLPEVVLPQARTKAGGQVPPNRRELSAPDIFARARRSLVSISAYADNGQLIGQGSGFFIDIGLVATALHVLKNAHRAYVKVVSSGEQHEIVRIKFIDTRTDLCVVSVNDSSRPSFSIAWKAGTRLDATVYKANGVRIGKDIFVVSNPLGLEGTSSKGMISSIRNDPPRLQIDAPISPGSSGGPVLNSDGEVIAVVTSSIRGGQGLNFASVAIALSDFVRTRYRECNLAVWLAGVIAVSDAEFDSLSGPVAKVVTRSAPYDEFGIERSSQVESVAAYDMDGNRTEYDLYGERGEVVARFLAEYEGGWLSRITAYTDGKLEETVVADRLEAAYKLCLGRGIDIKTGRRDHSQVPAEETKLDRDGRVVESLSSEGGQPQSIKRYRYDLDTGGNWIKRDATVFSFKFRELGFIPCDVTYRDISYHNPR